jgi:hypothetical protein
MPRFLSTPLYWHAVAFAVVVDIKPYSTAVVRAIQVRNENCQL